MSWRWCVRGNLGRLGVECLKIGRDSVRFFYTFFSDDQGSAGLIEAVPFVVQGDVAQAQVPEPAALALFAIGGRLFRVAAILAESPARGGRVSESFAISASRLLRQAIDSKNFTVTPTRHSPAWLSGFLTLSGAGLAACAAHRRSVQAIVSK